MAAALLAQRYDRIHDQLDEICSTLLPKEAQLLVRQELLLARVARLSSNVGVQLPLSEQRTQQQSQQSQSQSQPCQSPIVAGGDISPTHARLHNELLSKGITNFRFERVPGTYYDETLEWRRDVLKAASIDHLCKSIIMTNTRAHPSAIDESDPLSPANWGNPLNSRYYVVIVQYTARLNADKLARHIYNMANSGSQKVGKQFFNMRLAPEDVNDALSGYTHNAVSPIGMKVQLPMIISDRITQLTPDFFFLGGGEVDLKVGMSAADFVAAYKPHVLDITY